MTTIEIIPNRLFWVSDSHPPRNKPRSFYINTDKELHYEPFNKDFGPLNLAMTYRFSTQVQKLLKDPQYLEHSFYHYTSLDPEKRANAAYLICAFLIMMTNKTSSEAWSYFSHLPPFEPFRDAGSGSTYYECTILHCLRGLERAIHLGWFNPRSFDVQSYEMYEKVEYGDFNWIIPNKLLAFSSPSDYPNEYRWTSLTVHQYSKLFKTIGVGSVIRLNEKTYDERAFIENGLNFFNLFFVDGSCPSIDIVNSFISVVEKEQKAVAVHCKAGLGRTGTLIGCYAIRKYKFPAEEFIGWARICRPGSVLGPEQYFLLEYEQSLRDLEVQIQYSPDEVFQARFGDFGQANRLLEAKRKFQTPDRYQKRNENNPVENRSFTPASTLRSPFRIEEIYRREKLRGFPFKVDNLGFPGEFVLHLWDLRFILEIGGKSEYSVKVGMSLFCRDGNSEGASVYGVD